MKKVPGDVHIYQLIRRILVITSVLLFGVIFTIWLTVVWLSEKKRTYEELSSILAELEQDGEDWLYDCLCDDANLIKANMAQDGDKWVNSLYLKRMAQGDGFTAVVVMNTEGRVLAASDHLLAGHDYHDTPFWQDIMKGIETGDPYVKINATDVPWIQGTTNDYAAFLVPDHDLVCVLMANEEVHEKMLKDCYDYLVRNRRMELTGYLLVCEDDGQVLFSYHKEHNGQMVPGKVFRTALENHLREQTSKVKLFGENVYILGVQHTGLTIIGCYTAKDVGRVRVLSSTMVLILIVPMLVAISMILTALLKRYVVNGVSGIVLSLQEITEGNLQEEVDERGSRELSLLSDGINQTVDKLKTMINEAAKRYDDELVMAKTIQHATLPWLFPPYPHHKEFGLYAMMDTAKQVGGDFYDFFFLRDNRLVIVIADVSDKGIPAALFMMRAKTTIKALAVSGLPVDEMVRRTNQELYRHNEAHMFVTIWVGYVNLKTGRTSYVHAGHTCPVLLRDGKTSFVKQKRNTFVGWRSAADYEEQELILRPGDTLYLYTDGVTEAFNEQEEEYGNNRLENIITETSARINEEEANDYCKDLCTSIRADVKEFANNMPQSDDITMLCLKYTGSREE